MEQFLATSVIGIIATATMTSFLWLLTGLRVADVDMVRAIGSIVTRSLNNALLPGLAIHFAIGAAIAHLYVFIMQIPEVYSTIGYTWIGAFLGFGHGVVVSIALVVLVAEYHPVERYRKAGIAVALYHILAHVIYGLTVGLLVGMWFLQTT